MSRYNELPVYVAAKNLGNQLSLSTQKMPYCLKETFVMPMTRNILNIMKDISCANSSFEERVVWIDKGLNELMDFKITLRSLYDLQHIKKKGFSAILIKMNFLNKQLKGWKASAEKLKENK